MLPASFPFREVFIEFLEEYARCTTYWYVPKARTLSDETVIDMASILDLIFRDFLDKKWDRATQDELLTALVELEILEPYKEGTLEDRTALIRIYKKLLETLGFLWIEGGTVVITDAGLELLEARESGGDLRPIVSRQIAKYQFPNPTVAGSYGRDFRGLLPHLFLLQLLERCDYLTYEEFELFVNLAQSHDDLGRIANYIIHWRDLIDTEREKVLELIERIHMAHDTGGQLTFDDEGFEDEDGVETRARRVRLDASYQRRFYTYPRYLTLDSDSARILPIDVAQIRQLIQEEVSDLKIPNFLSPDDWFAYFGDPDQRPSWFTFLSLAVKNASSGEEAKSLVEQHKDQLSEEEEEEIALLQIEKGIESFYVERLSLLEEGLRLVDKGRQFATPIGRIDLLCKGSDGKYVVVEIKAGDAEDGAFGQILRYMGWIHRNFPDGPDNVRAILLAGSFSDRARYSRIGLLRADYKERIKFKKHGLDATDS